MTHSSRGASFENANVAGKPATYVEVPSRYGHDAFLVETETVAHLVENFLNRN